MTTKKELNELLLVAADAAEELGRDELASSLREQAGLQEGLRRYGPGKFNHVIDSYVYDLALDGADGLGDAESFNYYTTVHLGPNALREVRKLAKEAKDRLTVEEVDLIRESYGAVLEEDNQGFVDVEYFTTETEFNEAWQRIDAEWDAFAGGDLNDE